jgi:hypothetical protein
MRTPVGAAYKVVTILGKGLGFVVSRDIKANELILQGSPVLAAVYGQTDPRIFLLLPKAALEAIRLLHNAHPMMPFSKTKRTFCTIVCWIPLWIF